MRCYRRLNISYKDNVTNEDVLRKLQVATEEYDEFLTLVKIWKLKWFGHVSMSSSLAKSILLGTAKGKRSRGRQKKRLKCFEKSLLFFAIHLPSTPIYLTVIRSCIMIHNFSLYSCLYLMAKRLLLFVVSDKI